jgi:hypothetical protein
MRTVVLEEVKKEIEKMLEVGFIRLCRYAECIPSIVLLQKRMASGESAWISGTSTGPHRRMNTRCPLRKH